MGSKTSKHSRRDERPLVIEGIHAVTEALDGGGGIKRVFIATDGETPKTVSKLCERARMAGIPVERVTRVRLDDLSERGVHQGVVAELTPFEPQPLEALLRTSDSKPHLIVVADHLTDAGNLGALIRSAEAVGACGLVIPNRRSAQVTAATYKASAGAVAHLPIAVVPNIVRALEALQTAGYWVLGASEHATETIWDTDLSGSAALVVGNEATGLSDLVTKTCDALVALPMRGTVASLNVAQAATACCYEWLRQNAAALGLGAGGRGRGYGAQA